MIPHPAIHALVAASIAAASLVLIVALIATTAFPELP